MCVCVCEKEVDERRLGVHKFQFAPRFGAGVLGVF